MRSDYGRICSEDLEEKLERAVSLLVGLYTERTHFILELLQNAEDAGATRVRFDLHADRLEVWHDGRLFDADDVRGICGVGEGTKSDDLTQIGKFGIGFKSVYAFTVRPEIHCGDEHFAIEKYIRPHGVTPVSTPLPWTTLFILPFNRADVAPDVACGEIAQRLANLNSRTMLFLRHIREIEWSTPDGASGCYIRQEIPHGSARRVSIVGEAENRQDEETWLIFEAPVVTETSTGPLRVEAAFSIVRDEKTGKEEIAPVDAATLCVFFPTDKRTGLGFLIQGPYRTTPARDNVPEHDAENQKLVAVAAALVPSILGQLRDLGLLTVGALRTMPLRQADFLPGTMFRPIFDSVAEALRTQPLIPTDSVEFVSATQAKISRGGEIRKLFPAETLTALQGAAERLQWVSVEITEGRTPDLYAYFRQVLQIEEVTPESIVRQLDQTFLEKTSDDWLTRFYVFLEDQVALWRKPRGTWETPGPARAAPIIRLHSGTHVPPFRGDGSPNVYLSAPGQYDDVPLVKSVFVENERARSFLQKLGIDDFDFLATVREKLLPKYRPDRPDVPPEKNVEEIRFIIRALTGDTPAKRAALSGLIRSSSIVRAKNVVTRAESYRKPSEVYYESEELGLYFAGNANVWFLSVIYPEELANSLEELGVARTIRIQQSNRATDWQGNTIIADAYGYHERGIEGFDPDFDVDGLRHAVSHPTLQRAAYVWENIARPHSRQVRGVVERSSYKDFRNAKPRNSWSKIGEALSDCAWLPQNGRFVKPSTLSLDDLPGEFARDEALASRLQMKVDEVATLARRAGVDVEALTLAQEITKDQELYDQVRQWIDAKANKPEFPSRPTPNPKRRSEHVSRDAETAPAKTYEDRLRSVRTSEPAQDPSTRLRELYTNSSGQMVCQICEEEMPFKKRDGQYYFEAVEALNTLSQELLPLYLALCPVCAAKYKEFVKRDEAALQRLRAALVAADAPLVPLQLGGDAATLRFVDSHFLDIRTIIGRQTS